MKKYLLLSMALLCFATVSNAQLDNGVKLPGNVTGADVVSGEMVDLQAWLDDGKTVVVDVFATWCGPCWTFHTSQWLDDMNERFGPEGTDQIRILGVEADGGSDVELITMQGGVQNTANYSIGDWTSVNGESITYSIIDNPGAATTLGIDFFPTLYIIRPDGSLVEIGNNRTNEEFWLRAMGINEGPDAQLSANLPIASFCENVLMSPQSVDFLNLGDTSITSATLEIYGNGDLLETVDYSGSEVGIFQTGSVQVGAQNFTSTTEISAVLAQIDGQMVESSITGTVTKPELATNQFTFTFVTDFYPGEASWVILDDQGNVVGSDSYQAGNEDQFGGGGADALISHEYKLSTTDDISCLTVAMTDSYGDGFTAWTPGTHTQPGFSVMDQWGNMIKESSEGFFRFNDLEGGINTAQTTAITEIEELSLIKTYPNPIVDQLTIELGFTETLNFNMFIIDAIGNKVKTLGQYNDSYFKNTVDVSDLPSGIYTLAIMTNEGQNVSKFVKL